MKALVLGASGATGRLAVRRLAARGIAVRALLREGATLGEGALDPGSVELLRGSVADFDAADFARLLAGCDAAVCCLGHNLTIKGMFGEPRLLVRMAVRGLCEAARGSGAGRLKLVLMNTTGNVDRRISEERSAAERAVLGVLTALLPPQRDNVEAAGYLAEEIGPDDPAVEWVALRPDSLVDRPEPSPYEVVEAPLRSPLFDPGKTSRINVAAFMAELLADPALWERWRSRMPVIYDAESVPRERG